MCRDLLQHIILIIYLFFYTITENEVLMKLKEWLDKEKVSVRSFSAAMGITPSYAYNCMRGGEQFGHSVCQNIEVYTNGEVKTEDLRTKVKKKCPTCGRLGRC